LAIAAGVADREVQNGAVLHLGIIPEGPPHGREPRR
jgi:hypothetical protein